MVFQERQTSNDPERQRIVGEDGLLLRKLRQASDLILAEEKGRAEFVQGKPTSDCIYLKWHQVSLAVQPRVVPEWSDQIRPGWSESGRGHPLGTLS